MSFTREQPGGVRRGATRAAGRRAMAVVELLIALAISGMILVAVAYCVDSAFRAYSINQEQSDLMQRSRLAMHRILTAIRTTDAHVPVDDATRALFERGALVTDRGIEMYDMANRKIAFEFVKANGTLVATDRSGTEYVLVRGVENFEVTLEPMKTKEALKTGVYDRLYRASVRLTVRTHGNSIDVDESVGAQRVTLSSSAVPRRNVW